VSEPIDAEHARIARERDAYLRALYFLTRKEFGITPEELKDLDENWLPLGEIIKELAASSGR
jgi:hypothetical protein